MTEDQLINASLVLIFFLDIYLASLIMYKSLKKERDIAFAVSTLSVGFWTLGILMFRLTGDSAQALFWNREFIFTAGLIASTFLHFSILLTGGNLNKLGKVSLHLPNLFILILVFVPNMFIKDIVIRPWGKESILGDIYPLFGIYFSVYIIYALFRIFDSMLTSSGKLKTQLTYIFWGTLLTSIVGTYFNLYLILLGNYKYIWVGPYNSLFLVSIITYAITKHELMDIRVVISRSLAYGVAGGLLVASFIGLNAIRMSVSLAMATNAILALFWAFATHRLREFIQTPLEEKWITGWYDPSKVMISIAEKLVPVLEKEEAFKMVAEELKNAIKIKKVDILTGQEFPQIREISRTGKLVEIPFKSSEGLEGVLQLGEKISEDPYDEKDLRLFRTLQVQILVILDRIRPYEKIKQDFDANQQKLHEAEIQLERAQRLSSLGRIIAEVAHEIRNPLTIISSRAREINDNAENTGYVRESASLISERSDQIEKVVNTMQTLSQPPHYKPQEIDIKDPVESALRFMPFKKEIKIVKDYNPLPPIIGDKNELERVFINLFTNAYDAMSEKGGELRIRLQKEGGLVKIEIEDTGIGISKEDLPKVFEPFYTTKFGKIKDRMGFGLSICHDIIVNKHRGTITAESTPGKGTKFTIILPALS